MILYKTTDTKTIKECLDIINSVNELIQKELLSKEDGEFIISKLIKDIKDMLNVNAHIN